MATRKPFLQRITFLQAYLGALVVAFVFVAGVRIHALRSSAPPEVARPQPAPTTAAAPPAAIAEAPPPPLAAGSDSPARVADDPPPKRSQTEVSTMRQRLLQELLNAPPPTSTTPAAQQPHVTPSVAVVRPVTPPTPNPARPPAPIRPMPAQPHPVTAPAMTAGSSNNNTPTPPVAVAQPGDPESDTKAPQFIAASFDPPVVNDGATTTLNVLASDDLSGVKSITGNVIAPSGAVQAFGLGRDGDTNRFFTRITIAKDATAGIWHLNYLTLMDNAGNGTTASWKQGTVPDSASFRVDSSGSDSKPPDLVSVALDKPAVKGGDPETVVVQAQDDRSGVASISGVFLSPSGFARLGFSCRSDDGQSWRCDFVVPKGSECGDWTLDQMQLQDKAHNVVNLGRDSGLLSRVRMNVASDQCDSHPPVLQSVVLDKGVSTAPGMVVATLTVTDDSSGVASVGGTFVYSGPVAPSSQPPRVYLSCRNATGDQWTCNVAVPEKSPKGPYRLTSVQTLDKAQNLQVYDQSSPVLARIEFVVQ